METQIPLTRENEGFEALAKINDGFLGTGLSTASELAFIALGLIIGYVIFSVARYYRAGSDFFQTLASTFGLDED